MSALPTVVYHGATAKKGKLIEKQRMLVPRRNAYGNWSAGPFGGNPSNPDLVYCCFDKTTAVDYAKELCEKDGTIDAAVIYATPNYKTIVLDEDWLTYSHGCIPSLTLSH
jgi:hypothetical protein